MHIRAKYLSVRTSKLERANKGTMDGKERTNALRVTQVWLRQYASPLYLHSDKQAFLIDEWWRKYKPAELNYHEKQIFKDWKWKE